MKLQVISLWILCLPFTASSFSMPAAKAPSAPQHTARSAASQEEDLELTRQIIMKFEKARHGENADDIAEEPTAAASGAAATSSSSSGDVTYSLPNEADYATLKSPERPGNDLMIRAAFGETVEKTPTWLFRQAGRHLPEYQNYKNETNRSFLDMLAFPDSVAECTMQPLRRYDVDAAILFSDILVIAEALGIEVTMPGGVGIQVPNPLAGPEEVASRIPPASEMTKEYVEKHLGHVLESVRLIRMQMEKEGKDIPLIGFSAAPWTLLYYMVGGSSKKNNEIGVKWLNEHPAESKVLMETLTKIVIEYMSAQVENGAHMLQVFEAMGMMIDEVNFNKWCMPSLEAIQKELKKRYPDVPLMVFARGACYANPNLAKIGFDVVTMDGDVDRKTARSLCGDKVTLQGNYDPANLILGAGKSPETVKETVKEMIEELGPQRLIANLGEGLGGKESTLLVNAFVEAVHKESAKMIAADK